MLTACKDTLNLGWPARYAAFFQRFIFSRLMIIVMAITVMAITIMHHKDSALRLK